MELLLPFAAAVLIGTGVFLVLARALIRVILGLSLISYGVNLSILLSGGLGEGAPPLLDIPGPYVDPLPQALILTAIVIGFGTTALLLVLSIRAYQATGTDEVQELTEKPDPPAIVEPYADPERPSVSPERGPAEDRPTKKADKNKAEPGKAKKSKIESKVALAKDEAAKHGEPEPETKDEVAKTVSPKAKAPKKAKRKKPKAKSKETEPSSAKAKTTSVKRSEDDAQPKPAAEANDAEVASKKDTKDKDLKSDDPKPNDSEDGS